VVLERKDSMNVLRIRRVFRRATTAAGERTIGDDPDVRRFVRAGTAVCKTSIR